MHKKGKKKSCLFSTLRLSTPTFYHLLNLGEGFLSATFLLFFLMYVSLTPPPLPELPWVWLSARFSVCAYTLSSPVFKGVTPPQSPSHSLFPQVHAGAGGCLKYFCY